MIRRYNRNQILLAILGAAGGGICYLLAYLFFRHVPAIAAGQFGFHFKPATFVALAILALAVLTSSGYRRWKTGGGLQGYHESAFYHEMDIRSGGALMVDIYAHRITGSAHVLSQVFLAGPLGLLKCGTLAASRIPYSPKLEERLAETREILRAVNKWQAITEYPDLKTEILYLAQMGLIDFSTAKRTPRIKAQPLS